jgi:lipopolysaccharide cholinephosphotransferase
MNKIVLIMIIITFLIILVLIYIYKKLKPWTEEQLTYIHDELKLMMYKFHTILHKHNYQYFIIGGTLLGSVRKQNIIPHDDDIDIAILDEELKKMLSDKVLKSELYHSGLYIKKSDRCYKLYSTKKNGIFIDIFSYTISDNNIVHYTLKHNRHTWKNGWFYKHELYPLVLHKLDNMYVYGSNNPIPYLERHYGNDWMIPKKTHSHEWFLNLKIK